MAEQQTEQQQTVWRVVVHQRNAGGWWTVCPQRFWERADAQGWAAGALRRSASNAGVYPEVDGRVELPGWEHSRGARLEEAVAKACGLQVMALEGGMNDEQLAHAAE